MMRNKRHDLGNGNKLFIVKIVNEKNLLKRNELKRFIGFRELRYREFI